VLRVRRTSRPELPEDEGRALAWEEPRVWVVHPQARTAPDQAASRQTAAGAGTGTALDRRPLDRRPAVARRLDEDQVLIDVTGKAAYVLNPTAWASWELCDGRRSAHQIVSELASRYEAEEATVAPGLLRVLAFLKAAELLEEASR
jgi:hypothetical protein